MRLEPYGVFHKGLRTRLFDVCVELGRADFANPSETRIALDAWRQTVAFLRDHHGHEERFVEPMLRAIAPEVVAVNDAQHSDADGAMAELDRLADAVEGASIEERAVAARRLIARFQQFLVAYLDHLRHEETAMVAAIWAHFSDEQIAALGTRIQGSISPARFAEWLAILLPALNLDERAEMLGAIQRSSPATAFATIGPVAVRVLGSAGWDAVRARARIA